jgi:hypothetical protein
MTASEIARQLHGRKSGRRFQCRCPTNLHAHGDRNRSLIVWENDNGWVRFKCFTGCSRDEILAAMGLKVRDLALNEFNPNHEWEQRRKDEDKLKLLQHQHGLAIMAKMVITGEQNYWAAVERNIVVRGRALRDKLEPEAAQRRAKQKEVERIICEYGFDCLMECVPYDNQCSIVPPPDTRL